MKNKIQNIKIAAAQAAPVYLNKDATVKKACHLIEEAAKGDANLIVFPEAFIPGYPDWVWLIPNSRSKELNDLYVEMVKNAVSIGDGSIEQLSKVAGENNIYVVIGINEINKESSGGSLYNSLLYISEKGEVEGIHR
ncbi:MAG: carbon-nitrogen hydrolase family protein, partial [Candidatus Aminicenantes bacterium]|nr:carbon-nitrogen hydrolase family protein [Candidatus Aminicenantes bacterium]